MKFLISFFLVLGIDQIIKVLFLRGFEWHSKCLSLILVINKGVAFSLFSFLGSSLKYLQILLIGGLIYYFYKERLFSKYPVVSGIFFGAAVSNLLDRFLRGGVVDYVYYHCFFEFAVFNFADVMIDLAVGLLLYFYFIEKRR